LSALEVAFAFGVGLLFARLVRWSGSILGVALAHGMTNVTMFLIMPYLAQHASERVIHSAPYMIGIGTAVAGIASCILMVRAIIPRTTASLERSSPSRILSLRRGLGLTYGDLARRTGIPSRLLAEIEHGLRPIQPDQLQLIAAGLGVALELLEPSTARH
jgi:hypothetical protein